MIGFIKGIVEEKGNDYVLLDHNGLGFMVYYPHALETKMKDEIKVYTYMNVREDDISLFGFSSPDEKALFMKLISVKGLGPKTALNILRAVSMKSLIMAIEEGDVAFMKKLPGIGAKTASQIVLDLQGKLVMQPTDAVSSNNELEDALEALKSLGYKPQDINKIAKKLGEEKGLTSDAYLKMGLQMLMKL